MIAPETIDAWRVLPILRTFAAATEFVYSIDRANML